MDGSSVWVFNGARSQFPSAVFSSLEVAEQWIRQTSVTGTLTCYPIDVSVYDWVLDNKLWEPKEPHQRTSKFIGRFSSAYQDHHHYEDGERRT